MFLYKGERIYKMIAVLVCTHGQSAKELINSSEMICGSQENVKYVSFEIIESPDKLRFKIIEEINSLDLSEGLLFLTDLRGGTPYNVISLIINKDVNAEMLSGVNIPMLIETFLSRSSLGLQQLVQKVYNSSIQGIYRYHSISDFTEEDF